MNLSPLILFYRCCGTDHAGRLISEMHKLDFRKLESTHDYSQWVFSMVARSGFNGQAPVLTEKDREEFHQEPLRRGWSG